MTSALMVSVLPSRDPEKQTLEKVRTAILQAQMTIQARYNDFADVQKRFQRNSTIKDAWKTL